MPNLEKYTCFESTKNKPTNLKGQHNLYCLTYICGGPRHLSSFKQCSEDLIFL